MNFQRHFVSIYFQRHILYLYLYKDTQGVHGVVLINNEGIPLKTTLVSYFKTSDRKDLLI